MTNVYCAGCLNVLPGIAGDTVTCPNCKCTNRISEKNHTSRVVNGEIINMDSKKQLTRISDDLIPYLSVLKLLGYDYTKVINDGIAHFINELPAETKEKVSLLLSIKK